MKNIEFLDKIIEEGKNRKALVLKLKKKSKYYPEIISEKTKDGYFYSTLVRLKSKDKYYTIHCLESCSLDSILPEVNCLLKLMYSAHKIQYLHKVTGKFEDIDPLQISEEERLKKMNL